MEQQDIVQNVIKDGIPIIQQVLYVQNVILIVLMIIVIFLAECFCVSFEFYSYFKEVGEYISIFDAIEITPELLTDSEIQSAVIQDLAFAYIFGFVASISNIVSIVKSRKKKTEIQGE